MPEIPEEMKRNGRPKVKEFDGEEYLYRRVMPEQWVESQVDIDAIELPDMSVNRDFRDPEKWPPHWVLLEEERCKDWAVVGFKVKDIPTDMPHLGIDMYTFDPTHVPQDRNYMHSEVWCYQNGGHIDAKKNLDHDLHQRWREKLLWKIKTFVRPIGYVEE